MKKEITIVDGVIFDTPQMVEKAKKEAEGIKYLKSKLDMDNPEAVLQVYNRVRREKLFETPVGIFFLRELQEYLRTIPFIKNEDVAAIDFELLIQKAGSESVKIEKERIKNRDFNTKVRKKEQKFKAKEARIKKKSAEGRTGEKFRLSFIINIILAAVVATMIIISSTSGAMTIINYENKIIDKYEKWEKDLNQREQDIQEYEEKYNIPND